MRWRSQLLAAQGGVEQDIRLVLNHCLRRLQSRGDRLGLYGSRTARAAGSGRRVFR